MSESSEQSGEKEFEATEQRISNARLEGNVIQSKELNGFAVLIGAVIALIGLGGWVGASLLSALSVFLVHSDSVAAGLFEAGSPAFGTAFWRLIWTIAPVFFVLVLATLLSVVAQQSVTFSMKKISPKPQNISPVENLKKKYGARGLFEFAKEFVKFAFAAAIAVVQLWLFTRREFAASAIDRAFLLDLLFREIVAMTILFCVFQGALALLDWPVQKQLHASRLRMTREEMKKEQKQSEGDPQLKQSRQQKAAKISRGDMLKRVEQASVVMVNPSHYAVALTWDPASGRAPVCVAKGVDHLAARIREIATKHNIPIYPDPPATRSLHAMIDIDEEIRPEHFAAVASAIQFAQTLQKPDRS